MRWIVQNKRENRLEGLPRQRRLLQYIVHIITVTMITDIIIIIISYYIPLNCASQTRGPDAPNSQCDKGRALIINAIGSEPLPRDI